MRKITVQAKELEKKHSKWVFLIPLVVILLLVAAAVIFLILPSVRGEQSNPQKLLQKYYYNLYAGDLNELSSCMPEELRDAFEQVSTMGGVSSSIYLSYRQQMQEELGENLQVEVTINQSENAGSEKLKSVQADFPKAATVNLVDFDVKITGDNGSKTMTGSTYVTQIGGQWYFTTYNLLVSEK